MSALSFLQGSGIRYHYPSAPAITNRLANTSQKGAGTGSPGALPTGWAKTLTAGLSSAVIGYGTDSSTGLPYIDIKISGTATATSTTRIEFIAPGNLQVNASTQYTLSFYCALTAGAATNLSTAVIQWDEWDSSGSTYITTVNTGFNVSTMNTTMVLRTVTGTTSSTTASMDPAFNVNVTAGAVNATFRIAGIQLQTGAARTTFQSTPVVVFTGGTGGTVTGGVNTAPSQASAAGFNTLVFFDDFTTTTTIAPSGAATSGYNWYWDSTGTTSTSDYAVNTSFIPGATDGAPTAAGKSTGVLTINTSNNGYNSDLLTCYRTQTAATSLVGTWNHGYFESYLQFSATVTGNGGPSGGWPAFWLWALQAFTPAAGQITAECDIMEYYPAGTSGSSGTLISTLHNWANTAGAAASTDDYNTDAHNTPSNQPMDSGWHTYGCLWQGNGTTGTIQFYMDNVLQSFNGTTVFNLISSGSSPTTGLTAMETDNMMVILGTGTGWPLNVDWVKVWHN